MRAATYFVYILASRTGILYIGITNDLARRIAEHRAGLGGRFSRTYKTWTLVFFEETPDPRAAIAREKELKGWSRQRKRELIERENPAWKDLFEG